ncbi:MAG: cobalamin biosynthesis protein CobD [Lachnospiraceae bacterium]|nr:cobalamin biosynthesis protein CobD [Lachnospiraceae bacterium]
MTLDIIKTFPWVLIASFILDAIIGDPEWLPHPVRFQGKIISFFDKKLNNKSNNNGTLIFRGTATMLAVAGITGVISSALLFLLFKIHFLFGFFGEIIMSTYCLAGHDLIRHAINVYNHRYDLNESRLSVGKIVGRDISNLNEQGVIKATIESVAENSSDGVIAPAFYILLLGPVGGMVYKAINTMDSMIGYHNEKYEYYGKPAAKADDILNFIPSRLCAILIIITSFILKMFWEKIKRFSIKDFRADTKDVSFFIMLDFDYIQAFRIWKRDRYKHASPNSAQTESAMAGALGIRLGGPAVYFGKTVDKPYIGDAKHEIIDWIEIRRACILMYASALLMICVVCVFSILSLALVR